MNIRTIAIVRQIDTPAGDYCDGCGYLKFITDPTGFPGATPVCTIFGKQIRSELSDEGVHFKLLECFTSEEVEERRV